MPRIRLALLIIVLAAGVAGAEPPSSLDAVLDRYVAALGGRPAIESLGTRTLRGLVVHDLSSRTPPVFTVDTLTVWVEAGGRHLSVTENGMGVHRDGWDGAVAWSRRADGGVRTRPQPSHIRSTWWRDPRGPLTLRDDFPGLEYVGVRLLDGRAHHVIHLPSEDQDLYFDVESGLLVRLGFNRELHDYREVDGVLVPHRYSVSRKGGTSHHVFGSVVHGRDVCELIEEAEQVLSGRDTMREEK